MSVKPLMLPKPRGKCPKCGHRRVSKVFLGWHCRKCDTWYMYDFKGGFKEMKK